MVTFLVFVVILVNTIITILFDIVIFLIIHSTFVFGLQTSLLGISIAPFGAKAGLCLAHLVELLACNAAVVLLFEYLVLLVLSVLVFKFLNNCLGFLLSLGVFEVVHIQLVF